MKQEMTNECWIRIVAQLISDCELYEYDIAIRDKELNRLNSEIAALKEKLNNLERGGRDE